MRLSRADEALHVKRAMEAPTLTSVFDKPYVIERQPMLWPTPVKVLSRREKELAKEDAIELGQ